MKSVGIGSALNVKSVAGVFTINIISIGVDVFKQMLVSHKEPAVCVDKSAAKITTVTECSQNSRFEKERNIIEQNGGSGGGIGEGGWACPGNAVCAAQARGWLGVSRGKIGTG